MVKILLYCLKYVMVHGSGVVSVVTEAAKIRMTSVVSSPTLARHHSKLYYLRPKKTISYRMLKMCSLENAICMTV